jgi:hypothetical protein
VAKHDPIVEMVSWADAMTLWKRHKGFVIRVSNPSIAFLLLACAGANAPPKGENARAVPVAASTRCADPSPEAALIKWRQLIAPAVSEAQKTFPEACRHFLVHAQKGVMLTVTALLRDGDGHFQMSYVYVDRVDAGVITGRIAADLDIVHGLSLNDVYRLPASEILDWGIAILDSDITIPDGFAKGDFMLSFLNTVPEDVVWPIACELTAFPKKDGSAPKHNCCADR